MFMQSTVQLQIGSHAGFGTQPRYILCGFYTTVEDRLYILAMHPSKKSLKTAAELLYDIFNQGSKSAVTASAQPSLNEPINILKAT